MKKFVTDVVQDCAEIAWIELLVLGFVIFASYGALVTHPTIVYDFASAKGDCFQVFLTYFFMRRWTQGLFAAFFHDFSPLWNATIGLGFLFLSGLLLRVSLKRAKVSLLGRLCFLSLWFTAPFFYNRSVYQHALPCEAIAFCFDALCLLVFQQLRKMWSWKKSLMGVCCVAISVGVYQAHANLLLTAFLGLCLLEKKEMLADFWHDLLKCCWILGLGVLLWGVICYGPILICSIAGFSIPASGGAHDTIYWFEKGHTFVENFVGFWIGLLINWVYNAFFVVGLRFVLLAVIGLCIGAIICCVKRLKIVALYILTFGLSILAFPILQCASSNLRTYYCLTPFIAFTGLIFWHYCQNIKWKCWICYSLIAISILSLGHETASLYYFRWKAREQDKIHMAQIAHDLWTRYGTRIDKPVALLGGFSHYPTGWEDLRPFRFLPLLTMPFSLYSGVTSHNVPREFYMMAREQVGLVVKIPSLSCYEELRKCDDYVTTHPPYPQDGYIFEHSGVVIVNMGTPNTQWREFKYENYRSPNEDLLFKVLKLDCFAEYLINITQPIRDLAVKYLWALER